MSEKKPQSVEAVTTHWECWECGAKFHYPVEVCEVCAARAVFAISPPPKGMVSCVTPPESDADPNQSLKSKEKTPNVIIDGINQDLSLLTELEKAENYVGMISKSWADSMFYEDSGPIALPCCWCGEIRRATNYGHVVGPCDSCHKQLLVLNDDEYFKRVGGK